MRADRDHTELRVDFKVCERGASLQWHGDWLLYSNSEGNLAVIDTTGVHRAIELSSLVHGLLGERDRFRPVSQAWPASYSDSQWTLRVSLVW